MNRALFAAALTAGAVVAALMSGCGHSGSTGPSEIPRAVSLTIGAPATAAPGQTVSFTAIAKMSDGTTQDYTTKVTWSALPPSVMTINPGTGQATALTAGEATIGAAFLGVVHAQTTLTILAPGTYRLTGKVLESGLPVTGATIAVVSGIGAGLSATTDYGGAYRLYGVSGVVQIRFSKPGYQDVLQSFTAVQNDVLDFSNVTQTAPIAALAGTYTLTLTPDTTCRSVVVGVPALPDDFRSARSYAVSVTQDGPVLGVTLTDPAVLPQENHFTGRVEPYSIDFSIGSGYGGYTGYFGYGLNDGVAEQLGANQTLVFGGLMYAQRSGRTLTARLDGAIEVYTLAASRYSLTAQCIASNHQVTMTPVAQPSRR